MNNVLSLTSNAERAKEASLLLEQEILGGALYYQNVMPHLQLALKPEHFGEGLHQQIWNAICEVHSEYGAVGHALIVQAIQRIGHVEGPGMSITSYLTRLVADQRGALHLNPSGCVAELLNNHARREIGEVAYRLLEVVDGGGDPAAAARDEITSLDEILNDRQRSKRTDTDLSGALTAALQAAEERRASGGKADVSYGLQSLDNRLGGLWPGQLVLLGGRPAMGKSNWLNAILLNLVFGGHGVALFSKEMGIEEVGQRAAATIISSRRSAFRLAYDDLRRGRYDDHHREMVEEAIAEFQSAPVRIDAASGLTVTDIAARARRFREDMERMGRKLDVVMIDYLQIIRPSGRYAGNRTNEVAEISGALKQLAKQLGCAVILASQLSRSLESREDKRPIMSDLRDSGAIEQDADVICFLYRDEYYLARKEDRSAEEEALLDECRNVTEFIIAKQRHGATGTVKLFTDMATGIVRDLEGRY